MVELWGFSQTLHRIGEVAYVAVECGQPDATMLLDVYHIYKGGSDFHGASRPDVRLGRGRGNVRLGAKAYEAIRARIAQTRDNPQMLNPPEAADPLVRNL